MSTHLLRPPSSLRSWPVSGQTIIPRDVSDVKALAGGLAVSVALRTDGTVAVWGEPSYGQTDVPASLRAVKFIEAGSEHSLAIYDPQPAFRKATGTAQLVNGFVVGVEFSDNGVGYTSPPLVQFVGGGGTGASGTAALLNGAVVEIRMSSAGVGYTNGPAVIISPPDIPPELTIRVAKVAVDLRLKIGGRYELYSSKDLITWTAEGTAFTAESESLTREFDAGQKGQYFRIVQIQ